MSSARSLTVKGERATFSPMPEPMLATLGRNLAFARERKGLSREEAATAVGVGRGSLERWERGGSGPKGPSVLDLAKLSQLYRVSLDWLLGLSGDETSLPTGYFLVDDALVERIREAEKLSDLGKHVLGEGTVLWSRPIPRLRRILHPEDPELAELEQELQPKLERLRPSNRRR